MHLLLHLETNGDQALAGAILFAFDGYAFKHLGNGTLETTIDGSKLLSDAQWQLLSNSPYKV